MRHNNPSKKTNHPVLTLFKTGMLSWIILLAWAGYGWIQHGFTHALNAVQILATNQIELVSSFVHVTKILSLINQMPFSNISLNDLNPFLILVMQVWTILCAITHVITIKLCIIALSIPLFTLAILAGLVDGLSQRSIRTASLGRESTYIFHKSIPVIRRIFVMLVLLWLSLPVSLSPSPLFLSLAVLMGLLASLSASRFKKYL
jgi:integrating conjugative element membrane protein (TIGR03747 family)